MPYDNATSRPAYEEAKENINRTQTCVLGAVIALQKACDKDIAAFLGWDINSVTPRRGELLMAGKIEWAGREKNKKTNRTVNYYKPAA